MNDNMKVWEAVSQPPAWALKKIEAGRMKGKTDINPQWRIRALTEQFGMCGVGWKYTVDKKWTEAGAQGEIMCFVDVSIFIKVDGQWSEAIPGSGGSMLVAKESAGLRASDEGYKMATTDALSVACKMLGIAANIYQGEEYSKYEKAHAAVAPAPAEKTEAEKEAAAKEAIGQVKTLPELEVIRSRLSKSKFSEDTMKRLMFMVNSAEEEIKRLLSQEGKQ